jgi:hypothetical protein
MTKTHFPGLPKREELGRELSLFGIPHAKLYSSPGAGILAAHSNRPLRWPKNSNKLNLAPHEPL